MPPETRSTRSRLHRKLTPVPAPAGKLTRGLTILGATIGLSVAAWGADQVVTFSNKKAAFPDNKARLVTFGFGVGFPDAGTPVHSFTGGSTYVAQLYANGVAYGSPASFRTSTSANFAGTWDAPVGGVTLTGIPQYTPNIALQVKVWDITLGTYQQAAARGRSGSSAVFSFTDAHTLPTAGVYDQAMVNLQGFTVFTMPEPTTPVLAALGLGALFFASRRRKRG